MEIKKPYTLEDVLRMLEFNPTVSPGFDGGVLVAQLHTRIQAELKQNGGLTEHNLFELFRMSILLDDLSKGLAEIAQRNRTELE